MCIINLESPKNLKAIMPIGSKAPLYAGATSRCLLAFSEKDFIENYLKKAKLKRITKTTITNIEDLRKNLELVRKKGYAESQEELLSGFGALSAPILNHNGVSIAALGLAIPERRYMDEKHRKFCKRELLKVAKNCSNILGYHKRKRGQPDL